MARATTNEQAAARHRREPKVQAAAVKIGVYLNTQAPPDGQDLPQVYRDLFETAELLEALDIDVAFLPEHHQQPDGYLPSPFLMAAAVLARTTRLRVHTGIHLLPLWDPMRVAEDVAVLDVLSGGRFSLGVGLGLVQHEFDQFGVELSTAVSRFGEQLEVLDQAWSPGPVRFAGRHFRYDGIDVQPKPLTQPRPDVFIGAMSDASVERAGRLADGWLTDPLHDIHTIGGWAARMRASAARHGRPGRLWLQRDCWVSEDPEEITNVWAPHLVADWRFYFSTGLLTYGRFNAVAEPWVADIQGPDDITFDQLRQDRVVVGSPDEVVAQLQSMQAAIEPEGMCFRFRLPKGPRHADVLRAIELFGTKVLPALRAAG